MRQIASTLFVTALLALMAVPLAALPPQCDVSCRCTSKCTQLCAVGGQVTNCGAYGLCQGSCFAPQSANPSLPEQLLDDIFAASERVSSEANPECAPAL